jgi:CPA1 family monovalent cation:H+ antiporter
VVGGLRGSVSVALALSVPTVLAEREEIIAIVFGVMLFTLLGQGLTTQPLLARLDLLGDQPLRQEYTQKVARRMALTRVLERLREIQTQREIDPEYAAYQVALVEGQLEDIQTDLDKLRRSHPDLQSFAVEQMQEELLAIEADTYAELIRAGQLKEEMAPLLESVLVVQPPSEGGAA